MDLNSIIKVVPALASAAKTADFQGLSVDTKGYGSLAFALHTGTVTDGTTTVGAEYSDNNSDWTDVPADEIIGTKPVFDTDAESDAQVKHFGVVVRHRYYRVDGDVVGASTGLVIGGVGILGNPSAAPTTSA